jgi:hypothetical protein
VHDIFFINCFFITISTLIVTKVLNIPTRINVCDEKQKNVKGFIIIASIIVIISSMFSAVNMIRETITIDEKNNTITLVLMGDRISNTKKNELQQSLYDYGFSDKKLIIKQADNNTIDIEKYIKDKSSGFIKDNNVSSNREEIKKK